MDTLAYLALGIVFPLIPILAHLIIGTAIGYALHKLARPKNKRDVGLLALLVAALIGSPLSNWWFGWLFSDYEGIAPVLAMAYGVIFGVLWREKRSVRNSPN